MVLRWFGGRKGDDEPVDRLIFVLDDDGQLREAIRDVLTGAGHRVETFWAGPELFHRLKEKRPDLILLDINMPLASGWKVRQILSKFKETHDIPTIAVTATQAKNAEQVALEKLGFNDFIRKPFKADDLVRRVNKVLDQNPRREWDRPEPDEGEADASPRRANPSRPSRAPKPASPASDADASPAPKPTKAGPEPDPAPEPTPEPAAAPNQREAERPAPPSPPKRSDRSRPLVYVAAAAEGPREQAEDALRHEGYDVLALSDWDTLKAMLRRDRPDLLLIDVVMADAQRRSVLGRMVRDPELQDVALVALIPGDAGLAKKLTWLMGLDGWVPRAFTPAQVVEAIAQRVGPGGSTVTSSGDDRATGMA